MDLLLKGIVLESKMLQMEESPKGQIGEMS
jgi:hypothetical protein